MVDSLVLIQLDGALVITDSSFRPAVQILDCAEVVPHLRIFRTQLQRLLEIDAREFHVVHLHLRQPDLVEQIALIAATRDRITVEIQGILGKAPGAQDVGLHFEVLGRGSCRGRADVSESAATVRTRASAVYPGLLLTRYCAAIVGANQHTAHRHREAGAMVRARRADKANG